MEPRQTDIAVGQIQADIKVPGRAYLVNSSVDDRIHRNEKSHHHHDPRRHTECGTLCQNTEEKDQSGDPQVQQILCPQERKHIRQGTKRKPSSPQDLPHHSCRKAEDQEHDKYLYRGGRQLGKGERPSVCELPGYIFDVSVLLLRIGEDRGENNDEQGKQTAL